MHTRLGYTFPRLRTGLTIIAAGFFYKSRKTSNTHYFAQVIFR